MSKRNCPKCKRYTHIKGKEPYCEACMKLIYQRTMASKVGRNTNLKNKNKTMIKFIETEETPVEEPTPEAEASVE